MIAAQNTPSADTGIKPFTEKETNVNMYIAKKITKHIQTKEVVKTDIVKEGTEGIADTTTTQVDAIWETTANTFTPEIEKKHVTIWIKHLNFMKN